MWLKEILSSKKKMECMRVCVCVLFIIWHYVNICLRAAQTQTIQISTNSFVSKNYRGSGGTSNFSFVKRN